MLGAVLIWYAAGAVIAAIVVIELVRARREQRPLAARGQLAALFWFALAAAFLIFLLWPWVALNLAENAAL